MAYPYYDDPEQAAFASFSSAVIFAIAFIPISQKTPALAGLISPCGGWF